MGYYYDPYLNTSYGFLDTGGVFTTIDLPGTNYTVASGINDNGQVVGFSGSAAPEPGTLVLFGTGMIGLVGALRRKIGTKS